MTTESFALVFAAAFCSGCIVIHALRDHARVLTPTLTLVACCLGLFVCMAALADRREQHPTAPSPSIASTSLGATRANRAGQAGMQH